MRVALFTHVRRGEIEAARFLAGKGVAIVAQKEAARLLRSALGGGAGGGGSPDARIETFANRERLDVESSRAEETDDPR